MDQIASDALYDRIGGRPAARAAIDRFYNRVLADPELKGFFAGASMRDAHSRLESSNVTTISWRMPVLKARTIIDRNANW